MQYEYNYNTKWIPLDKIKVGEFFRYKHETFLKIVRQQSKQNPVPNTFNLDCNELAIFPDTTIEVIKLKQIEPLRLEHTTE